MSALLPLAEKAIAAIKPYELYVAYAVLGVLACVPIIVGARMSVDAVLREEAERVSHSDAMLFPVIASAALVSFYLLFKYFSQEYINHLLTAYFAVFGVVSMCKLLDVAFSGLLPRGISLLWEHTATVMKRGDKKPVFELVVNAPRVLFFLVSAVAMAAYVWTKHWMLNDLLGVSFALTAVSSMHLDSFQTGFMMLALLFVYDIFWVFKTDVMVSVAKAFDVPVKLLVPRYVEDWLLARPKQCSLLGLGDIVIPGVFIALCHRFDSIHGKGKRFGYFHFAMTSYVLGLVCTVSVMHVFKAAQPALLYLSPACILSTLLCAVLNGEVRAVWNYSTEEVPSTKKKAIIEEEVEETEGKPKTSVRHRKARAE